LFGGRYCCCPKAQAGYDSIKVKNRRHQSHGRLTQHTTNPINPINPTVTPNKNTPTNPITATDKQ